MSKTDKCVLCNAENYKVLSTKLRNGHEGTVVRCSNCNLVRLLGAQGYADKLNDFYAEEYAQKYYSGIKGELDSLFDSFSLVQGHRIEKITKFLDKSHRVLEVGSGTGYFLNSIQDDVAEVQGIELNRKEAQYASDVRGVPTSDLPFESTDLPHGHYDHLCLFQVLEHAANPIEFLSSLKPFLRDGGHIHIEIPNLMDPLVWFYNVENYRDFYYQEPHLYYFTPESLTKICEAAGLKPINVYGFQQTSFANHVNWLYRQKPQSSRWDCIQPTISPDSFLAELPDDTKIAFDELMCEFNQRYIKFMERHDYSDMVFATLTV